MQRETQITDTETERETERHGQTDRDTDRESVAPSIDAFAVLEVIIMVRGIEMISSDS